MLKMNAGEQSFNHIPFTIDCINELIVQLDYNIEKQTKYHIRRNEVMEKTFLILIQYWAIDYFKSHLLSN